MEELSKQRVSVREDIPILIQETVRPLQTESVSPLQTSVNIIRDTVDSFQNRLTAVEFLPEENFEKVFPAESAMKSLQTQNAVLLDRIEDLESANLRIINVPEDSEGDKDTVTFEPDMLIEMMDGRVFNSAPALERSHRVGKSPLDRLWYVSKDFQEKEQVLCLARQYKLKYKNSTLRIYPDFSVSLSKRQVEFNDIKHALYKEAIDFQLFYPACLLVSLGGGTLKLNTPEEAKPFYDQWVVAQDIH